MLTRSFVNKVSLFFKLYECNFDSNQRRREEKYGSNLFDVFIFGDGAIADQVAMVKAPRKNSSSDE